MKKFLSLIMVMSIVFSALIIFSTTVSADYKSDSKYNLLDAKSSTFEGGLGGWVKGFDDTPTIAAGKGITGDAMFVGPRANAWSAANLNVAQIILDNGVGTYDFSFYAKAAGTGDGKLRLMFRGTENYGFDASPSTDITADDWALLAVDLNVTEVDKAKGSFTVSVGLSNDPKFTDTDDIVTDKILNMTFDNGAGPVYIDDVCIVNTDKMPTQPPTAAPTASPAPTPTLAPTATKAPNVATNTPANTTPTPSPAVSKGKNNTVLIVVLVSSAVVLIGAAAALFLIKPKKKGKIDTDKPE